MHQFCQSYALQLGVLAYHILHNCLIDSNRAYLALKFGKTTPMDEQSRHSLDVQDDRPASATILVLTQHHMQKNCVIERIAVKFGGKGSNGLTVTVLFR